MQPKHFLVTTMALVLLSVTLSYCSQPPKTTNKPERPPKTQVMIQDKRMRELEAKRLLERKMIQNKRLDELEKKIITEFEAKELLFSLLAELKNSGSKFTKEDIVKLVKEIGKLHSNLRQYEDFLSIGKKEPANKTELEKILKRQKKQTEGQATFAAPKEKSEILKFADKPELTNTLDLKHLQLLISDINKQLTQFKQYENNKKLIALIKYIYDKNKNNKDVILFIEKEFAKRPLFIKYRLKTDISQMEAQDKESPKTQGLNLNRFISGAPQAHTLLKTKLIKDFELKALIAEIAKELNKFERQERTGIDIARLIRLVDYLDNNFSDKKAAIEDALNQNLGEKFVLEFIPQVLMRTSIKSPKAEMEKIEESLDVNVFSGITQKNITRITQLIYTIKTDSGFKKALEEELNLSPLQIKNLIKFRAEVLKGEDKPKDMSKELNEADKDLLPPDIY